jgi:hypothetical protein
VPRGTLERYVKDISRSPEKLVNVHLERRNVIVSFRINFWSTANNRPKILWIEMSEHKTHGFSVGNKNWFETSI